MNRSYRHALKRLTPATALVVATGLAATGLASGSTAAAAETTSAPALKLVASPNTQTIVRDTGARVYLGNLGIHAVAEQAAFEVRTLRGRSYRDPIKATLTLDTGAGKKTTTLPSTLFTDVDHLNKFFAYSVTDHAGEIVKSGQQNFCPNSDEAARVIPTGAARSPYPDRCGDHPFARGGVLGLQRGWAAPAFSEQRNPAFFEGEDGLYTVQLVIQAPWRKVLGLTAAQSTASVKIKVKTGDNRSARTSDTRARPTSTDAAILPHTAPPSTTTRTSDISAGSKPDLRALPAHRITLVLQSLFRCELMIECSV